MSFTANVQRSIIQIANTLVRSLQDKIPTFGRGAMMTVKGLGRTLIAAGLLILLPSFILNALGFTGGGVLQGSIAAFLQSFIFGGQTAGWFSVLQTFGATAIMSQPAVIGVGGTMAIAGASLVI